jgi:hypothetical protein
MRSISTELRPFVEFGPLLHSHGAVDVVLLDTQHVVDADRAVSAGIELGKGSTRCKLRNVLDLAFGRESLAGVTGLQGTAQTSALRAR